MEKIYGKIYVITNLVNNKQYVGRTIQTLKLRFIGHMRNSINKRILAGKKICAKCNSKSYGRNS